MDIKIGDLVLLNKRLGYVSRVEQLSGNDYYIISWCDTDFEERYTGKSSVVYGKESLQAYLDYADR